MDENLGLHITPDPSGDVRGAVLEAVQHVLRREAELAAPASWRLAGWTERRVGLGDLAKWVPAHRRWPLSARWPAGGRVFEGLIGRADAK